MIEDPIYYPKYYMLIFKQIHFQPRGLQCQFIFNHVVYNVGSNQGQMIWWQQLYLTHIYSNRADFVDFGLFWPRMTTLQVTQGGQMLSVFIFSESVSQGGSNDMKNLHFKESDQI